MESYDVNVSEGMYAKKAIPEKERKSWIGVAAIYFGMTAALSAFATGGALISGLTLIQSIGATILGTAILVFLFFIPTGNIGAREGLNTYMIGEAAFGSKGSNIATAFIITIIPCVGWYGVQVSIAATALTEVLGGNESLTPWMMIILGIIFCIPAMFGVISMAWLDYLAVPAILIITIYGFSKAMSITGMEGLFEYTPTSSQTIVWGANLMVGSMVVGASFTADYTRWTRNKLSHVSYAGIVGNFPPLLILTIIAAMMGISASSLGNVEEPWNIAEVMKVLGLPIISLFLVIIMQWSTNITSSYSAGLALTKVFGWSRFWWTLIAAIVGTVLSLVGIMQFFIGFLGILAAFVAPAAGVIISEYYFVSKGKLNRKNGLYWPGIISWLIGGFVAFLLPFFIPAVNGAIISAVIYYLYHTFLADKKV
ncbi:purine-cytosine permease family protein [Pseudogracilibacillus auburnensis]|uniref:Purine-cytosine permease-like protein n=1 Tax=Pseudogracilibacillus auburnensis TaxID=1494959 RepID=A0A2V3VF25_9BACI|nr:cytosine permease [Pseudogracilibacillus auburnensis]PXW80353.1 purine-cytosine permease-like protein [Pseudogracilibacillus auburnensis]